MNDDLLLSAAEVVKLTGRVQHAAQISALRSMGIEHRVRPNGTVAVAREHVLQVFGVVVGGGVRIKKTEPDFSGMKA